VVDGAVMTRDESLALGQERRLAIARLRREIRAGRVTLAEVLADPPETLLRWPLIDVVRLVFSGGRGSTTIEMLGRDALGDGVNLMLPLGRSSEATRAWLVDHVDWGRWSDLRRIG
jgi:hypothetical protein